MTEKKLLACPVCNQTDFLRANVMQDVDVTVDEHGDMDSGFGFSCPEIDESGELFCSRCGSHLRLNWTPENNRHIVLAE